MQVISDKKKDKSAMGQQPPEDSITERKDEKQGVGQAQTEKTDTGHYGDMKTHKDNFQTGNSQKEQKMKRRQNLQESDNNRSLGELNSVPTPCNLYMTPLFIRSLSVTV
jgi:hypothetical protein